MKGKQMVLIFDPFLHPFMTNLNILIYKTPKEMLLNKYILILFFNCFRYSFIYLLHCYFVLVMFSLHD